MSIELDTNEVFELLASRAAVYWDFDGVILDSMAVRDVAFEETLKDFAPGQVAELLRFHRANGGWSRYIKFRHFQSDILKTSINENQVQQWAQIFSDYCSRHLNDPRRLIEPAMEMVRALEKKVPMHIVSGSDGTELRKLCEDLKIAPFFQSIDGSPTPKTELISDLMERHSYHPVDCMMIGDSHNDYEAAAANGMPFTAFRYSGNSPVDQRVWNENGV